MSQEKLELKTKENEELKKYTYIDHSTGDKVVFECIAKSISEADKMYQEKTGKNPEKQNYIGCDVKNIELDIIKT